MRFRPVFLSYFCSQLLDEDIPPADFATVRLELDRAGLWKGGLFFRVAEDHSRRGVAALERAFPAVEEEIAFLLPVRGLLIRY